MTDRQIHQYNTPISSARKTAAPRTVNRSIGAAAEVADTSTCGPPIVRGFDFENRELRQQECQPFFLALGAGYFKVTASITSVGPKFSLCVSVSQPHVAGCLDLIIACAEGELSGPPAASPLASRKSRGALSDCPRDACVVIYFSSGRRPLRSAHKHPRQ